MGETKGRIAVIAMDVRLPGDAAGLDREAYIAATLAEAGFEVELITSAFQHWEKRQRDIDLAIWRQLPYQVTFIPARSYGRNITPSRVLNHAQVARRVRAYLAKHDYDLVFAKMPPNDLARVCAEYAAQHGIPLVVDVNDLWPEAMRMVLDVPVVSDLAFSGFARDAEAVYAQADAVVGTSDSYAARALAGRNRNPELLTVYVGTDVAAFDAEAAATRDAIEKPEGEWWATYAGTLGESYALDALVRAAALAADLREDGEQTLPHLRVKILGDGPERERLEQLAAQLQAPVDFLGYLPHDQMAGMLVRSDCLVNSFGRKAPQSIVSKVGDYLAAGRPMVNTLADAEFCAKVEHDGFGINVPPEDVPALAAALLELAGNADACERMGARARETAEAQFDRPRAYQAIVGLCERLLA